MPGCIRIDEVLRFLSQVLPKSFFLGACHDELCCANGNLSSAQQKHSQQGFYQGAWHSLEWNVVAYKRQWWLAWFLDEFQLVPYSG